MPDPSKVLVTGGTGFIGRHVVGQLLQAGVPVRVLCRSEERALAVLGGRVEVVVGDITSSEAVARACRGVGQVLHVAGFYEFGIRHRDQLWHINVEGTRTVIQAARAAGVPRMVHCSTSGILSARGRLITEQDFPGGPPLGCGYKRSKWHAEREALEAARQGMDVVIASPTAPIGPGDDRPTPTGRMIVDLLNRRFPACSRTGINVVAVEDVARGLLAVAARGERGQRYILGHDNLWLDQFLARVAAQLGVPAPRAWVPWLAVALGGIAADAFSLCTGRGGGRLCWETAYFARQVQFFDLGRSRRDLGWTPTIGLDAAIAGSVAWFSGRMAGKSSGSGTAPEA